MLGKRREREETSFNDNTTVQTSEDDEEESKSRVIQKRSRLDPFISDKKKGKGLSAPTTVPRKPVGNPPGFEIKPEREKLAVIPPAGGDDPGPSLSKNVSNMASTPE